MKLSPLTIVLPAYWASYLVNGDASGITPEERANADAFLARHNLPAPVSCEDERFSHRNAASALGGNVMDYTFLMPTD